jgi:hypothetical protein
MELPIRIVVFDRNDPENKLKLVSCVKAPAIGFEAIKFSNQSEYKLAVQSEEKRIIFTPVLIPNQLIYRDMDGVKFNLMFEAPTIEDIAIQFAEDHLSVLTDIDHSQKLIDGVVFYESFILSGDRVSGVKGFEGIPLGTWFLTGKVTNEEVWQKIKNNEITGVSIDGVFKTVDKKDHELATALEKLLS